MKVGDRIQLMEDMDDLSKGKEGKVVEAMETYVFKKDDKRLENPTVTEGHKCLAVLFDGYKNPAIGRMIQGGYIRVIDKCKAI